MDPYYADSQCTLYLGDAREILPGLGKESVDLLVADPPYGESWQSGRRQERHDVLAGDESRDLGHEILSAAVRTLRPNRHLYVFGPREFCDDLPLGGRAELIWDRKTMGSGDLSSPWGPQHDVITFATYMPWPSGKKAGNGNLAARMRKGSVISVQRPHGWQGRHPTEKPVQLMWQLVESSSSFGDLVLNPCAGSCSTGVAATLAGRRSILIEREEKYCESGAGRLARAASLRKQMIDI